ncbi:hypothetical protein PAHAL_2G454500 [Panicum hallii]|uniref:RING-type domain-containing protein n=2 Tax=Panicum hallii TaxID=206008 RepID=A0A2S3H405_9POAL|nr:uncharacterized protein LOC112883194 isoform X1 [Panicum hallii]PAN14951.1 hypothetical protein PAHAL_2G454500 [Panicum hallii]
MAECHHVVVRIVDLHDNGDAESHRDGGTGSQESTTNDDHVMDIGAPDQDDADCENCCVVCTEPLEWVAVGRCGHRVVCRKCMVRIRFFYRNKHCCICKTHCSKVIVTKRDTVSANIMSKLPLFALREGRVGEIWYHRHTAAYYEDEQEYNAARAECKGIISPFYQPWYYVMILLIYFIVMGVAIGTGYALEAKHRPGQVRAYAVSVSVAVAIAIIFWSAVKCCTQVPLEIEAARRADMGL